MYKVIHAFVDSSDSDGHVYLTGDTYPREGFEPTAERIMELESTANGLGFPVIEKAEDPVPAAEPVEEPEQAVEQVIEAEPETIEVEEPVEEQEKPAEPEEKPAAARSGRGRKRANAQ